jgi:hypothetical protein
MSYKAHAVVVSAALVLMFGSLCAFGEQKANRPVNMTGSYVALDHDFFFPNHDRDPNPKPEKVPEGGSSYAYFSLVAAACGAALFAGSRRRSAAAAK